MKYEEKVTSYKDRWKSPNEWLTHYLGQAPVSERLAFAERVIEQLPPELIEEMYQQDMTKEGYYATFQARLGPGYRARRRRLNAGKTVFEEYVCWMSEIQIDGHWVGISDKTSRSGLMQESSAAEAREKAKKFLDEMIAEQEADKLEPRAD